MNPTEKLNTAAAASSPAEPRPTILPHRLPVAQVACRPTQATKLSERNSAKGTTTQSP